jgi:hypothetical protein
MGAKGDTIKEVQQEAEKMEGQALSMGTGVSDFRTTAENLNPACDNFCYF